MLGTANIQGEVYMALSSLLRVGVITGFKITRGTDNGVDEPLVTVSVPENRSLDEVRNRVMNAVADVALGITVAAERTTEA